jgi:hypothetical protein
MVIEETIAVRNALMLPRFDPQISIVATATGNAHRSWSGLNELPTTPKAVTSFSLSKMSLRSVRRYVGLFAIAETKLPRKMTSVTMPGMKRSLKKIPHTTAATPWIWL